MYRIKAPNDRYERRIGGVRFVNGAAETEDAWLASWFSGRPGFTVEPVDSAEGKPAVQDRKPAGKRGTQDDKGEAEEAGGRPAARGAGNGA